MTSSTSGRRTRSVVVAVLTSILWAAVTTRVARAEDNPALSGEPLAELAGHGLYWGTSIVGADGGHPIENPEGLWLGFRTLIEYPAQGSEEEPEEHEALAWNSNCNGHSYRLKATATRLNLSHEANTRKRCTGHVREEETWLERFFSASPHWRLGEGHLTLTAGGSRIVTRHRHRRPSQ